MLIGIKNFISNNLIEQKKKLFTINSIILFVYTLIISYVIGIRDSSIGSDTQAYKNFYNLISQNIETRISEYFFLILAKTTAIFQLDSSIFLMAVSFLSITMYIIFFYKLIEIYDIKLESTKWLFIYISLIITLISPFFWNSELNVIRVGLAIPIFLLSIVYFYKEFYLKGTIILLISIFTHFSMLLFLPFLLVFKLKNRSIFILFLTISLLYISGISQAIFIILSQKFYNIGALSYYFDNALNERGYKAGIRYDFWVFTSFFFVLLYKFKDNSNLSNFLIRLYFILFIPFLLIGYINFSDRLLLAVWSLIPATIGYLIIKKLKNNELTHMFLFILLIIISIIFLFNYNLLEV